MTTNSDGDRRATIIAGLRAFADFLEQNPDIPAPQSVRDQFSIVDEYDRQTWELVVKPDAEKIETVRRIAALLGVEAHIDERSVWCEYPIAERTTYVAHGNLSGGEPA